MALAKDFLEISGNIVFDADISRNKAAHWTI